MSTQSVDSDNKLKRLQDAKDNKNAHKKEVYHQIYLHKFQECVRL